MKNKQFRPRNARQAPLKPRLFVLVAVLFAALAAPVAAGEPETVVFLVRHAEKTDGGRDPVLAAAGKQRAARLADLLEDAGIGAVHSSDTTRTRETARPLAERLGLTTRLYDPREPDELLRELLEGSGRHLVVGHGNTVPGLVAGLGGAAGPAIDEAEYDRLYIVTRRGTDVTTLLLRYGERFSP